jgi:hypothetical protein
MKRDVFHRLVMRMLVISLVAGLGMGGCAGFGSSRAGLRYEEQHGPFSGQAVNIQLSRKTLDQAISRGSTVNSLRMVEIFRRAEESGAVFTPQYRLFDIRKGGAYDLVGLQTNDVLLAAAGLVVFDPQGFKTFVTTALRAVPDGTKNEIFVSRGGIPLRIEITTLP